MKAPEFWQNPPKAPGWQPRLLAPLAALYSGATARRVARAPTFRADVPVICIGNLSVGGSGKTPTAIAIAERLAARRLAVHVVSRGYGGRLPGPVRVQEGQHSAADVGDEPLLLAAFTPTWVSRDRANGVRAAQAAGADVILLDDGFQNPDVWQDLSIIVVDAKWGFGNGRVMPAGPLREPVTIGLARADMILCIGHDADQTDFAATWPGCAQIPRTTGRLEPLETGMSWTGLEVLAFAGIGHPEKFFATLRELGADLVHTRALDDHQPLGVALMKRLEATALALNAQLVTTEKDAVRLPKEFRQKVLTLPVRLHVPDWGVIDLALEKLGLGAKNPRE